ncbi:hypothetical protein R3P38DRAFT_2511992 [Favolaschia claudopus]|uniref:Nephrocystin 3-like N-terminal domain-containing protein n=1 Tax=Favolaschia claudopus TaxID=2862362 RepID=A0AAW0CVT3_9AGAR
MRTLYEASSKEASYDWGNNYDRPSCHQKTREEYLLKLEAWSQEDCPGLFWMYGPAGTGKSAIMQSFCEHMQQKSRLGASFFFKRDHPSRGDAMKVFPTLAYHLARASPELELAIATIVGEDPAIFSQTLAIQLQQLILGPCQTVTLASPWVIGIDGLDECGGGQKSQQAILRTIGNAHDELKSSRLAILIASRPEPDIESVFNEPCLTSAQRLEIRGSETDVRTYLVDQFQRIRATHESLSTAPISWPGDKIIEDFVWQSSGHFIYASTVIKFIDDEDWVPGERMRVIQGIEGENPSASPFFTLDQLYKQILTNVPNQPRLLRILSIIAAGFSMTPSQMGSFLQLEPLDIRKTLRRLHSLIKVPEGVDPDDPRKIPLRCIFPHHASLSDFLNDPARSEQFHFDSAARHGIALRIVELHSQWSEPRLWPPLNHVLWHLSIDFITTTHLSPDLITLVRQVNLDLAFGRTALGQVARWLKQQEQSGPVDLIRRWEDYEKMGQFQKILDNDSELGHPKEETDSFPEAPCVSPDLVRVIQTCALIRPDSSRVTWRDIITARWLLNYSWEELQSTIVPISSLKDIDIQNLCLKISSPLRIQELNPDQTLQRLAKDCMELFCWQLQRLNDEQAWV